MDRSTGGRVEQVVRERGPAVGQQHLLSKPDQKERQAKGEVLQSRPVDPGQRELRHHFRVMQHRPGDQVGEVAYKQRVVQRIALPHLAGMDVREIGNLRKCEERNSDRQDHVERAERPAAQLRYGAQKEIRVLEVPEKEQINPDCGAQQSQA